MKPAILGLLIIVSSAVNAQRISKSDKLALQKLQDHVTFLADDKLEGRRAGSSGEIKAVDYISEVFKGYGLLPMGTKGSFKQNFEISDGLDFSIGSSFTINKQLLDPLTDYFPYSYKDNVDFEETSISPSLSEIGLTRFINIGDILINNRDNPHFDLQQKIRQDILSATSNKAKAIILFNSSNIDDNIIFDAKAKSENFPIPVLYLTKNAARKHIEDVTGQYAIKVSLRISPRTRTASNVIGYIDNGAKNTIVLGAHIDHLGYGEDGNSMIRNGPRVIHNGADDNASGSAAMLEIARHLSKKRSYKHNFLFIGFSGEELGLLGSRHFVENPTISLNNINYMINMDMVGRLNDSSKTMTVGGYGTSKSWDTILNSIKKSDLRIKLDSSGAGPSDHTSFYRKNIPVLFFFTGLHTDYHRPTDDTEKINFKGTLSIVKYILSVIDKSDKQNKLSFLTTREQQTTTTARFSVSLGIMPDYAYSGLGVRVDGVSDGRPAKLAGMIAGDVLIKMGTTSITSVESYMQILSKYKKGDAVEITILRGTNEIKYNITF